MMEGKDWLSFFVGIAVIAMGALPLLNKWGVVNAKWAALSFLPIEIFSYLVAALGFYLLIDSISEITNSNAVGWWTFLLGFIFLGVGVLQSLHKHMSGVPDWFELSFIKGWMYYIIFVIEGFFLMIAAFAMEL